MRKEFRLGMATTMAAIFLCGANLVSCSNDNAPPRAPVHEAEQDEGVDSTDYTLGRQMNARLGKGINLGNAWDGASYYRNEAASLAGGYTPEELNDIDSCSNTTIEFGETGRYIVLEAGDTAAYNGKLPRAHYNYGCPDKLDANWSNPIKDEYFEVVKKAGFNSVRIPVRWQHNSNPETHQVSPERLAGVKEDVKLAIDAGLAVVVSFHWYYELMYAAKKADSQPEMYQKELEHFTSIWTEVATAFEEFPDTMLVWDILNEPTMNEQRLNEIMTAGYTAIRAASPGKTIMFESKAAAKFAEITSLKLPKGDGNVIFSGHYYEPYNYTHQGHGYACKGDATYSMKALADIRNYVAMAQKYYPDINGSHVPMNMGEFGVAGAGTQDPCKGNGPTARMKTQWVEDAVGAAEKYDLSWHYWGLTAVGGFEVYNTYSKKWLDGFPEAFGL